MGAIRTSVKNFYDMTSELVGIKSGLLLNQYQIKQILKEVYKDDFLDTDDLHLGFRIRSEDFEGKVVYIRKRVGNLPEISPTLQDYQIIRTYMVNEDRMKEFFRMLSVLTSSIDTNPEIDKSHLKKFLYENIIDDNVPSNVVDSTINIAFENVDHSIVSPSVKNWTGETPLSDLFDLEVKPKRDEDFLDQKFLDYLAINSSEIELIHWRNFERLCAQYFKREGYEVILGPGTNDGGVDIRVFSENDMTRPTLLIQCKRYIEKNKISIETVKAFYTDVMFEGAKNGLIATTGYISEGGKKVCDARSYNITFAEKQTIEKWAKNMWTFSPKNAP